MTIKSRSRPDDIPAGWSLDTSAIIISGGGALGGFTLVGDTLTIDITGAPAGAAITAAFGNEAADDSDVDGSNLIVRATVMDGAVVATGSSTLTWRSTRSRMATTKETMGTLTPSR